MPKIKEVIIVERKEILPTTKKVNVLWECPKCGEEMGEIRGHNFYEDGTSYFCHTWDNPCGHTPFYDDLKIVQTKYALDTKILFSVTFNRGDAEELWTMERLGFDEEFLVRHTEAEIEAKIQEHYEEWLFGQMDTAWSIQR